MYYIGTAIVFFVGGWIVSWLIMRNNPTYFNIDEMGKEKLQALLAKIKEKL